MVFMFRQNQMSYAGRSAVVIWLVDYAESSISGGVAGLMGMMEQRRRRGIAAI
jgi:hypothetical protein